MCNTVNFQKTTVSQDGSRVEIIKLFDCFHFESVREGVVNSLSIHSDIINVIQENKDTIINAADNLEYRLDKLEARFGRGSEPSALPLPKSR